MTGYNFVFSSSPVQKKAKGGGNERTEKGKTWEQCEENGEVDTTQ